MKIFLSSTYQDLHAHRQRVIEVIDRLRHSGADVEWFGMEAFGARDDLPADACLQFVDACDLYIGLFGVRYGSIDPKSGKSMTEIEYRRAVERKKSRLIFLIDEQHARVAPSDFEVSPEGQQKLRALKNDLMQDRVADFFTSPEDLAFKVSTALAQHLPISNLQSLIPLPPLPYFVHPYPLQAHFTGRARERAALSEWLTRGERQTAPILVIPAIGGMGKSALAWYWLHNDIGNWGFEHWALSGVFWWSFYTERDFGAFLRAALEYASRGAVPARAPRTDRERLDALVTLLRQNRMLLVLDGFERVLRAYARLDAAYRGDEVDADAQQHFRACADPNSGVFLRAMACGGCLSKLLITSRLFPRELDDLASVESLPLTGMDADDAVEFFRAQKIRGTRAEIRAVCADYGFHPLSLRLLAGALAKDPRYHNDIRHAPRINPLAADKERKILDLAYDSLPPREQKLLSQLAAFRSPLAWDAIATIFAPTVMASRKAAKQSPPADSVIASRKAAKQSPMGELEIASAQKPRLAMTEDVMAEDAMAEDAMTEDELARALTDLQERGLCMRDAATNTFDLHPVIRRYCYDRLADKQQIHATLAGYFSKEVDKDLSEFERGLPVELRRLLGKEKKIHSLADLQPTIELYHHTVRAGRYDEACELFRDRLNQATYYQLGAYQLCIELLRALFPDGEDKPPRLKDESAQAWTLNALANSYALAGQPRRAVSLFLQQIAIWEKQGVKKSIAIGLGNVATQQLVIGELKAAEQNLRRRIEICREIEDEFREAIGHQELGRVLAYRGQFAEAERELAISTAYCEKTSDAQGLSIDWAYRALRALLMGDASAALAAARKAREFAEETARTRFPYERDFIRAEWLIGAALVAGVAAGRGEAFAQVHLKDETPGAIPTTFSDNHTLANASSLQDAERHLHAALTRDRAIGLVELEAAILLEWARLRFAQAVVGHPSSVALLQESFEYAREALEIAERCEYRLQQADIHNFLAEWWMAQAESKRQEAGGGKQAAVGDRSSAVVQARTHAARAKECARCDGAPYHYKVAYERAENLLKALEAL